MGATASEKAQPHHAPGSLPCQPRRCLLWQEGGRPPGPCWCRPCCPPLPQLRQQGTEVCYPVQKVEPTTITEQSCLIKGEVECTEVVVATIPKVTCSHAEHTKPAGEAVETE